MNELQKITAQLPDTLEDLTQFVLVGKAKLDAYILKLRTVNRLSTAQEIRDQTLKEAQEVSTALIAAEQRIGELLLAIPKQSGMRTDLETSSEQVEKVKTKGETISDMGYSKDEASDYQRMAQNPKIVQQVIDDAIANGDVVTKSQVMKEIAEAKRQLKEENDRLRKAKSEREMELISEKRDLEKRLEEANNRDPEKVEVEPEDYKAVKVKAKQADAWKKDYQNEQLKVSEKNKEILSLKDKIEELKSQTAQATSSAKLIEGSIYFVAQCGSFVRDMGGYVWIADKIAELPENERVNFIKAIDAIKSWAEVLHQNIERNM